MIPILSVQEQLVADAIAIYENPHDIETSGWKYRIRRINKLFDSLTDCNAESITAIAKYLISNEFDTDCLLLIVLKLIKHDQFSFTANEKWLIERTSERNTSSWIEEVYSQILIERFNENNLSLDYFEGHPTIINKTILRLIDRKLSESLIQIVPHVASRNLYHSTCVRLVEYFTEIQHELSANLTEWYLN